MIVIDRKGREADKRAQLELELAQAAEELHLDPEQADAVYMLRTARCGVVTGGPGRGKTRSLQAALPLLAGDVALCAPSGKAARRMAELTQHPASTVHRLLGLKPGSQGCMYHRSNPLPFDVVIVDEASTLDVFLLQKLLAACDPRRTRVFFIGDVDQLPSVGPGQALEDLIASDTLPVVRLETMHRSAAESWVCVQAPEILEGRIDLRATDNFRMVETERVVEEVVRAVSSLMAQHGREEVQCIVPMNVGDLGANVLNKALQERLNPGEGPSFGAGRGRARMGDSIVAIENDYDRGVFNGETGVVRFVDEDPDGEVVVDFGDRQVSYKRNQASEFLRLSYALTVHKMQGSEARWIVLAMHEAHGSMLTRKLLYTAVTRARQGVVIVGQESAVRRAVAVADTTARCTTLQGRLVRADRAGGP